MRTLLVLIFTGVCSSALMAQPVIVGPYEVAPGDTAVYTYTDGNSYPHDEWEANGGDVIASSHTGTTYTCTVVWYVECSFAGDLDFTSLSNTISTTDVTIVAGPTPNPDTNFDLDKGCRSTLVTPDSSPPPGVTWYWQTAFNGTDDTHDETSYTLTTPSALYLRAKFCGNWSDSTVRVHPEVIDPSTPTITNLTQCGSGTINLAATPGTQGDNIKWYNAASGGSPIYTGTTMGVSPSAGTTATYYVTSYNTAADCQSTSRVAISATTKIKPDVTFSPGNVFSGQSINVPPSDTPLSTISWTVSASGVTGASNGSSVQGAGSGPITSQQLSLSGSSDGSVEYSVTPSLNGCNGQTRTATVNVYKRPAITASSDFVFKGYHSTLSTGAASYDSYQWLTSANALLSTSSTYSAALPGGYKVAVTKSGATATTDVYVLYSQFDGLNMNYVITRQPQIENITTTDGIEEYDENEVTENIQYVDGLGRPIQTVGTKSSPLHYDVVQPVDFDKYGRESTKYLPFTSDDANGRFKTTALKDGTYSGSKQAQFYDGSTPGIPNESAPYSVTKFEESPLNRVIEQGAPGTAWQPGTDHTVTKQYLLNTDDDEILSFTYDPTSSQITLAADPPDPDAYYKENTLTVTKTLDEEQNDVIEFVDKEGRTICKKVKAPGGVYAATYYIYDDFGGLVVVLPPEAVDRIINAN